MGHNWSLSTSAEIRISTDMAGLRSGSTAREIAGRRLTRALDALSAADADLARARDAVGVPPRRGRPPGFAALLDIIIAQQVSVASARAIRGRLTAAADPLTPDSFLGLDDVALRAVGFSRQKMAYGRGLAEMLADGRLDLDAVGEMDDEAAIAAITEVKGLGRWSAEVYLLFCLHRPDVMPADDLALLVAVERLKRLPARPSAKALRAMADSWRPWRSVAARLLWHYYAGAPVGE
jgi:DNA-3-methyladenine glycosylase II